MFRYRFLLLALFMIVVLSGCGWQAPPGPTDLIPILCHTESGVGMLFITIENHGNDAGPSTTKITFESNASEEPYVQLEVKTPGIPSGADILIAVDFPLAASAATLSDPALPFTPDTARFLRPVGKITITVDSRNVLPETERTNNVLVTDCHDRA